MSLAYYFAVYSKHKQVLTSTQKPHLQKLFGTVRQNKLKLFCTKFVVCRYQVSETQKCYLRNFLVLSHKKTDERLWYPSFALFLDARKFEKHKKCFSRIFNGLQKIFDVSLLNSFFWFPKFSAANKQAGAKTFRNTKIFQGCQKDSLTYYLVRWYCEGKVSDPFWQEPPRV